jgi:hypothetical protein
MLFAKEVTVMSNANMNVFTDVLKKNREFIFDKTSTLPGIVLAVQKVLVDNDLNETEEGKLLVNTLLQALSYNDAVGIIIDFMN